jgi:hypothetical protein
LESVSSFLDNTAKKTATNNMELPLQNVPSGKWHFVILCFWKNVFEVWLYPAGSVLGVIHAGQPKHAGVTFLHTVKSAFLMSRRADVLLSTNFPACLGCRSPRINPPPAAGRRRPPPAAPAAAAGRRPPTRLF